jgi:hypothetical protein
LSLSQLISPFLFFYLIFLQMKTWEFRVKSSLISERRLKRLFPFVCSTERYSRFGFLRFSVCSRVSSAFQRLLSTRPWPITVRIL